MRANLVFRQHVYAEKKNAVSSTYKNSLQEKQQEIKRILAEMAKEAECSEAVQETLVVNDEIKNMREQEVIQCQNFVLEFMAIGCYNHSYA